LTLPSLDHLVVLTDDTGVIQHATYNVPNRSTGYCTDDVARAFLVACAAARHAPLRAQALRLGSIYLSFLHDAQLPDGRFHNFMGYDRTWLDDVGGDDAIGRAVWAIGYGMRQAPLEDWRAVCTTMLHKSLPAVRSLEYARSQAFAALGLAETVAVDHSLREPLAASLRALLADLHGLYESERADDWEWFEGSMLYDNARLSEALLRGAVALGDRRLAETGLRTLAFYESVVFEGDQFVPIGNDGWHRRGGHRARFDQQPLEAAAMVDAELAAYAATGDEHRLHLAERAFAWFFGANALGTVLVHDGGCYDGISKREVNRNMGAESTLAYLVAALALAEAPRPATAK
jgi:hypothetical protein